MPKKMLRMLPLLLIFVIALFFRVFLWERVPARLTVDEMSIGYNAYSIFTTGKDEWGRKLPLMFEAFGDFKLPLYIYLSVPFVALFGLNMISIKIVSLISGLLFVLGVYFVSIQVFDDKKYAYVASFLAALSPWAVHLSRQGLESNLALALFTFGVGSFIGSIKSNKNWEVFSGILFGFSFYAYVAYRLNVFLFLGLIVLLYRKKHLKVVKKLLISFAIVILPLFPSLLSKSGTARLKHVSIFTDPGIVSSVNENRSFCYLVNPKLSLACKFLFHKPQEILDSFVSNYVSFLSPEFLFLNGDEKEYLANPGYGEYLWIMLAFLVVGGYEWMKKKDKNFRLVVGLFLISPIAGALAGKAQMVRGSMLLLPLTLILGYGLSKSVESIKKVKYGKLIGFLGIVVAGYYLVTYYVSYFVIYPSKFDYAAYQMPLEVTKYLKENGEQFDYVYVNDYFSDAHIAIAYFLSIDPSWYMENVVRPEGDKFGFSHPIEMGKYKFGAESFAEVFCDNLDKNGIYISDQSLKGNFFYDKNDTKKLGYFDEDYKNFSGVHSQARIITFSGMKNHIENNGYSVLDSCKIIIPN